MLHNRELFALFYNYLLTDFSNTWCTDEKSTPGHFFFFVWYSNHDIWRDIFKKVIFYHFYTFLKGRNSLIYFSIELIFFPQVQDILMNFFCSLSTITFQKSFGLNVKILNFLAAILDFGDHLRFSYWLHTFL